MGETVLAKGGAVAMMDNFQVGQKKPIQIKTIANNAIHSRPASSGRTTRTAA